MKKIAVIFIFNFLFYSCVKDKPSAITQEPLQLSRDKKVYVINEGGFGSSQASVSLYDPATGQAVEDFYKAQNNETLGDVAQSVSFAGNNFYLVVNNSNKIIVCDRQFKKTAEILNLSSPRYLLAVTNSKAYVSELGSAGISIIDLNSNVKTGTIKCAGWTEKMALIYNKVFVTNLRRNYVYVLNTLTDQLSDSIVVGLNAGNIVIDQNDKVWVMSDGDQQNNVPARLYRINPVSHAIELNLTFAAQDLPGNLCLNKTKDTLYYINNGVFRLPISAGALPQGPFIPANGRNFYGLGINPESGILYAADALDYVQRSNIYLFDLKGNQLSFFKAGIISNGFYFE
ncbi:MAG TPA: hypothetical protein PL029_11665 [Bacteroidia bacterium]|nr:hypothetical protein [Bacteroidia bacterium]